MRPWMGAVLSLSFVAASCGAGPDVGTDERALPPATTSPSTSVPAPSAVDDLVIACGSAVAGYAESPPAASPLDADALSALDALAAIPVEGEEFVPPYEWGVWERSELDLVLLGETLDVPRFGGPRYGYASFRREGNRWVPAGWGQCHWGVRAERYGPAEWVIDSEALPIPESSSVTILATEHACASGQAPEGRDVRSVVQGTDAAVTVIVLVEGVTGAATCQVNPAFRFTVDLGEPLGDRVLLDGHQIPAVARYGGIPEEPVPLACSADGLGLSLYDPGGLPQPVADTRTALAEAALACDFTALINMMGGLENQGSIDQFWFMGTVDEQRLRTEDQQSEALKALVRMLDTIPTVQAIDDGGSQRMLYIWPSLFGADDLATLPAEDIAEAASALGLTEEEMLAGISDFGGYAYFRVGIWEDGTWAFALSGD